MNVVALLLAWLTVCLVGGQAQANPASEGIASPVASPVASAMRVYLLENSNGKLSEQNALELEAGGLWNRIAGPHASNAALVLVDISGPPSAVYNGYFGPHTRYRVRLVATESGRAQSLLDQTQAIPVLTEQGKTTVGFLIHPGGCKPVRLVVSVEGARASQPFEKFLPFACGE